MPRAGAGLQAGVARGLEAALRGVEPIDEDLVEPEVRREREPVLGIEDDGVRVRPFLPPRVRARPPVLDERGGGPELAVARDGKRGHAAPAVVRDEDVLSRGVDRDVAGPVAPGWLLTEERELSRARIDREGAHRPSSALPRASRLVHGIEEPSGGMDGEEGRAPHLGGELDGPGLSRPGVEAKDVDALRLRAGVRADVGAEILLRGPGNRGGADDRRDEEEQDGSHAGQHPRHSPGSPVALSVLPAPPPAPAPPPDGDRLQDHTALVKSARARISLLLSSPCSPCPPW